MRRAVRRWGRGSRTAALVHGYSDDAQTWWRTGPALAHLGFTVLAPDLRGHGHSERCDSYLLEDFAADLVDSLPVGLDLAVGHSLGGVALGLAAGRLQARRTLFVDPPWSRPVGRGEIAPLARTADELPPATSAWSLEDVAVDLASNARVDPRVAPALGLGLRDGVDPPPPPEPGSVVLVPALDPVLPPETHDHLAALGYAVVTHPGVRHVVHRDDPAGFVERLRGLTARGELVA